MAISPQRLTIYLYSAHGAVIFAIAQLSCCCRRRQENKERKGKVHKVTRRYILAICGAETPRPIPIKFGMRVAPCNVINVSNFCNKIFRGFTSTGGQSPRFPIDFAGHRYNSAVLPRSLWSLLPKGAGFISHTKTWIHLKCQQCMPHKFRCHKSSLYDYCCVTVITIWINESRA